MKPQYCHVLTGSMCEWIMDIVPSVFKVVLPTIKLCSYCAGLWGWLVCPRQEMGQAGSNFIWGHSCCKWPIWMHLLIALLGEHAEPWHEIARAMGPDAVSLQPPTRNHQGNSWLPDVVQSSSVHLCSPALSCLESDCSPSTMGWRWAFSLVTWVMSITKKFLSRDLAVVSVGSLWQA